MTDTPVSLEINFTRTGEQVHQPGRYVRRPFIYVICQRRMLSETAHLCHAVLGCPMFPPAQILYSVIRMFAECIMRCPFSCVSLSEPVLFPPPPPPLSICPSPRAITRTVFTLRGFSTHRPLHIDFAWHFSYIHATPQTLYL